MAKSRSYMVYGKLDLDIGVEVSATSLEDAVVKAESLEVSDFVSLDGHDYSDGNLRITGVYEGE